LKYFSGKFGRIRAKFLRTPQNLLAPTPMIGIVSWNAVFAFETRTSL